MTVSNERKVAEIHEYILEDRRVPVENVAEHFGISYGTAQDIMSNKLTGDDFHISDSITVRSCTISYCIVCNYVNYIE